MKFMLFNINPSEIDEKYNFTIKSNIDTDKDITTANKITNITDIETDKKYIYSYLDQSKHNIKCLITMNNLIGTPLPKTTNIHCYWCRSPFNTTPIGCPIKYINNTYTVDGIFCSFNCCKAFIDTKKHDSLYTNSDNLINKLYFDIYNNNIQIKKAPTWKLLNTYGGNQSISKFRESFNMIEYKDNNNYITQIPEQFPISWIIEEHVVF